jgi:ABC-2 type transport system permease protein
VVNDASRPIVGQVTDPVIAIHDLVKTFGATRALDGLDLSVAAGEVHGFLGPNGAGKSTTIRALLGLLRTDSGSLSVFGLDPWADSVAIHRRLAYVPGDVALWPNLSGGETVDMLLRMRGVDPRGTRREELLERFDLDPTKRGRAYSKGNRQKVALVAAFAADVDLLVLDEPTSGLDPLMEEVFADTLAERVAAGTTVLLSSHILSEVERLADRVTIIRGGRAVESGSLAELRHLRRTKVVAEVAGPVLGRAGGHDRGARRPVHRRRALADQRPADPRGAVPRGVPPRAGHRAMTTYAGTWPLVRVALRRDRLLASVWVLLLVAVVYASAAATESLYPTVADRLAAAEAINNSAAIVALYGPILDVTSLGELAMTKLTVLYAVFVALLFLVLVRRHTRSEEESGRAELLGGTAVGRDAQLAAAVLESALVALALGVLATVASVAGGLPVAGSVWFAASWVGVSWVAIGLTAVACQASASARTCAALAGAGLGVFYVLRVIGDTGPGWVSWLSPFGWSTRLRAWSDPRWWVLLLYLALGAVLIAVAQVLQHRRDLGAGLVAARPGPAEGSPRLADAFVLAWRTHRTLLASWSVGAGVLGLVMGAIAPSVGDLLDTEAGRQVIESLGGVGRMQDALVAAVLSIAGVAVTCFAIAVIGHGAGDERDGRTEQVLATAVSRSRSFLATAVVALGGATWLLLVSGVGTALGLGLQAGGGGDALVSFVGAALGQSPAVWTVAALALLLYAVGSRYAVAGWAVLAGFFALGQLGELLDLPAAVTGLSPYTHLPAMPVEPFAPATALTLTAVAAAILGAAWWRFRERDIR